MEGSQGSWPFMSARLQECPERRHDLADDLESFMHVLNYCALKHLPNAASTEAELAYLTQCLYDAAVPTDTPYPKGSPFKLEKVQNGSPFVNGLPADHPLASLLAELSQLCKQHYRHAALLARPSGTLPSENIFARGSCCGAQVTLPDYDGDLPVDTSPDELDARGAPCALPSTNSALSPLQSHDSMVGACMKAIRKVWPAVDRRERLTRTCPRARRGPARIGSKRTWGESEFRDEVDEKCKRARKNSSATLRPGNTRGLRRRRSSK